MSDDLTGQVNGWYCPRCGRVTYGIHLTNGVTPMFLACRSTTPDCAGTAFSLMYPWSRRFAGNGPLPAWLARPKTGVTLEWYKPERITPAMRRSGVAEHVANGGLLVRPLTSEGMRLLEAQLARGGQPKPGATGPQ